jgi:hypothetical protein
MTKKDFQFFAELFADHAIMAEHKDMVKDCIGYFKKQNPLFDEGRFYDAIYKRRAEMLEELSKNGNSAKYRELTR